MKTMTHAARVALVLAFASISASAQASARFDRAWTVVAGAFREDMTREGVVGGALWFARDGRILKQETHGYADIATRTPIDADTIYHWASITKPFTGIGILQLRDRGLISLDDPVVKYVPAFAKVHDPFGPVDQITIRHLLTHTAGLREATWPWGGDKPWHAHEPADWSQVEAMFPYTEIQWAPGTRYSYSNPGISILGRIIEVVTREPFETYMDKNILRPLDMDRAYFDADPPFLLRHRGHNYSLDQDGRLTDLGQEVDTGATVANGGLNAPIGDMMKFANFLLGVGDRGLYDTVLSRASLTEMMTPVIATNDSDVGLREQMALTFFIEDDIKNSAESPVRYIGHTGSQAGYRAIFYIEPRGRTAAIAAWNTRPASSPRTIVYATRRRLFDSIFPLFIPST